MRRHPVCVLFCFLFCLLVSCSATLLAQWPQFRGPGGQGHSAEGGLPAEWNATKNVAWKVAVPGRGWSSPIVSDGRVWLTTATTIGREGSLRLLAFDAASGTQTVDVEVFKLRNAELLNAKNSHASPTPILEADRVYVHFGAQGTAAVSTSGEIVWKVRHQYESQHGGGGSPILHGDLLIFSCDGFDEAFVIALDKRTGKTRWRTERPRPWSQAYSTPLVIREGDRDLLISVGAFHTVAYDPTTGKEVWHVNYPDGFSNVPRPVYGHGLVFVTTGFQQPAILAIRPDGKGDVTRSHVAWTASRGVPLTPSPLVVGNELYLVNDAGIVSCLDAGSGLLHWQQRLGASVSASPVFADGRIYFLDEEGTTTVILPGTTFQRVATNALGEPALASMAVANGSFFVRTTSHLYRISSPAVQFQPLASFRLRAEATEWY